MSPESTTPKFENFYLRRLVRENHGAAIMQVAVHPRYTNLIATVGANQASVYDNEHCGNHLDIVTNFTCPAKCPRTGEEVRFTCCAWLRVHPDPMDAWLAVGGQDGVIRLLSVARSAEFLRLGVPDDDNTALPAVVEIQAHTTLPELLAVYADGSVRSWQLSNSGYDVDCRDVMATNEHSNVGSESSAPKEVYRSRLKINDYQHIWHLKATSLYIATDGTYFLVGTRSGAIHRIGLAENANTFAAKDERLIQPHGAAVDCLLMADQDTVISKSMDGKLVIWSLEARKVIRTLQLKNNIHARSRPSVSGCGTFICAGDLQGCVTVYQRYTGEIVREFHHKRANRPVLCCVFSRNDQNLLVVGEDGCIWRWDQVDEATLAEWARFHTELRDRSTSMTS